jgi:DNA-binding CsgD family transcriptional regulator
MTIAGTFSSSKGGRPAVLVLVLATQVLATAFFVLDTIEEAGKTGLGLHNWVEALVTLALIGGGALGAVELRRVLRWQVRQDAALAKASGEMHSVIQRQFDQWGLSKAERDVAYLALKGLDVAEIAAVRNAASGTVRAQLSGIYGKSGVSGRAQFAAFFVEDLLSGGLPD